MHAHAAAPLHLFASSASPPALAQDLNPSSLRRLSLLLPIFLSSGSSLQATYLHTSLLLLSLDFQSSFRHVAFSIVSEVLLQPVMRLASPQVVLTIVCRELMDRRLSTGTNQNSYL
jgi:hypothetical protein